MVLSAVMRGMQPALPCMQSSLEKFGCPSRQPGFLEESLSGVHVQSMHELASFTDPLTTTTTTTTTTTQVCTNCMMCLILKNFFWKKLLCHISKTLIHVLFHVFWPKRRETRIIFVKYQSLYILQLVSRARPTFACETIPIPSLLCIIKLKEFPAHIQLPAFKPAAPGTSVKPVYRPVRFRFDKCDEGLRIILRAFTSARVILERVCLFTFGEARHINDSNKVPTSCTCTGMTQLGQDTMNTYTKKIC